ncbi:hypothetical protein HDU96_007423 [Phlyctochytrium bullatum]|nr:hypothetical protein HDU96_007423 [Phlyctochytrium bullatum]
MEDEVKLATHAADAADDVDAGHGQTLPAKEPLEKALLGHLPAELLTPILLLIGNLSLAIILESALLSLPLSSAAGNDHDDHLDITQPFTPTDLASFPASRSLASNLHSLTWHTSDTPSPPLDSLGLLELRWLLRFNPTLFTHAVARRAAHTGRLHLLRLLHSASLPCFSPAVIDAAAASGHLPVLTHLLSLGLTPTESGLVSAARNNHLPILAHLLSLPHPPPLTSPVFDAAARAGNVPLLRLLDASPDARSTPLLTIEGVAGAVPAGIQAVAYLHATRPEARTTRLPKPLCADAARRGDASVVAHLLRHGLARGVDGMLVAAAGAGHVAVVETLWTHLCVAKPASRRRRRRVLDVAVARACEGGHEAVVAFLVERAGAEVRADHVCWAAAGPEVGLAAYVDARVRRGPTPRSPARKGSLDPGARWEVEEASRASFDSVTTGSSVGSGQRRGEEKGEVERAVEAVKAAAGNGRGEGIRWLTANGYAGVVAAAVNVGIEAAAAAGHVDVVVFLMGFLGPEAPTPLDVDLHDLASNGHLAMLKHLHEHPDLSPEWGPTVTDAAAAHGHLIVTQFLHAHHGCTTAALDRAVAAGHAHVVAWLLAQPNPTCTPAAADAALARGDLDMLDALERVGAPNPTPHGVRDAAREGHVHVVRMALDRWRAAGGDADIETFDSDPVFLWLAAAEGGDLDVVGCLLEAFPDAPVPLEAVDVAAGGGHTVVVRALVDARVARGCHPPHFSATGAGDAARGGHVDVVRFLHAVDSRAFTAWHVRVAAGHGRLAVLQFLGGVGLVCGAEGLNWAARNGHLHVVRWCVGQGEGVAVWQAMCDAAVAGRTHVVRELWEGAGRAVGEGARRDFGRAWRRVCGRYGRSGSAAAAVAA